MNKLSIAVTTYMRYDLTIKSFEKVIEDDRVSEIIVVDDASPDGSGKRLAQHFFKHPKVKVIIQAENFGMSLNKCHAISFCANPFVLILDSDNSLDSYCIDALPEVLDEDTIYMPQFARPNFDFRKFAGQTIDLSNVKEFITDPMGNTCANCCNYVVNRNKYMEVYQQDETVKETDTVNFFYLWIKSGKKFHIVKGMEYDHLVHPGSGWLSNAEYNMKKGEEIRNKILSL